MLFRELKRSVKRKLPLNSHVETYETKRAENRSGSRYTASPQFRLPDDSGEKKAMRFRLYHRAQGLGIRTVIRTYRHRGKH